MKIKLALSFLALFSGLLIASERALTTSELEAIDFAGLLKGKELRCIRPYYRFNYPLIRLGGIRTLYAAPAGPVTLSFDVTGNIPAGSAQSSEEMVYATFEGEISSSIIAGELTDLQSRGLFSAVDKPWAYEMPVSLFYAESAGMLMNMRRDFNQEQMDRLKARLEQIVAHQNLDKKRAIVLLSKDKFSVPPGRNDISQAYHQMVIILSYENDVAEVTEVLFVNDVASRSFHETLMWCAQDSILQKSLADARYIRAIGEN